MINRFKIPLALVIIGLTFVAAGIYFTLSKNKSKDIKFSQENLATASGQIIVHLSGEVNSPGVYRMPEGSRVDDLLKSAGGLKETASKIYLDKTLNLAAILKDGMKIYIPKEEEDNQPAVANIKNTQSTTININSAPISELDSLEGIGAVRAKNIIDNRPYQRIEELVEKKIIGQSVFEKIKEKISVF